MSVLLGGQKNVNKKVVCTKIHPLFTVGKVYQTFVEYGDGYGVLDKEYKNGLCIDKNYCMDLDKYKEQLIFKRFSKK